MSSLSAASVAVVLAGAAACAQTTAPPTPAHTRCEAPEQRQFDFWIGHWTVVDAGGGKLGENSIERIDNGCALIERWRGKGGVTGTSLSSWDAETRQWHQHWVDSQGGLLRLAGGLQGKHMVLAGSGTATARRERISWAPAADGAVRQLWEASDDGGATWTTVFDGRYLRQP